MKDALDWLDEFFGQNVRDTRDLVGLRVEETDESAAYHHSVKRRRGRCMGLAAIQGVAHAMVVGDRGETWMWPWTAFRFLAPEAHELLVKAAAEA